jgi:cyclohexanone monooxygenase
MTDKWKDGVRTLHGYWMHDFPNLFLISNLQSGFTANFVHMLSRQAKHIAWIVAECKKRDITEIECTQEAEDAWGETILKNMRQMGNYQKECTPGYYNLEGKIFDDTRYQRSSSYGLGPMAFCKLQDDWREKGDMEGLALTYHKNSWDKRRDSKDLHANELNRPVDGLKVGLTTAAFNSAAESGIL